MAPVEPAAKRKRRRSSGKGTREQAYVWVGGCLPSTTDSRPGLPWSPSTLPGNGPPECEGRSLPCRERSPSREALGAAWRCSKRAYLGNESSAPRPDGAGGQHDPSSAPARWRKSRSSSGRRRRRRLMQLCPAGDWRFMAAEDGTGSGGKGDGGRAAHSPR